MTVQRRLIVAVFNERSSAENAIEQLYNAGVSSDRISYSGEKAGVAGGGFLESIKNLFGGTHTHTPTDVMQDLSNMGLAEDEAQYYAQEYAAGRTIVAVHPDEQSQNVLTILQSGGGYHFHSPEGTGPAAQSGTEANVKDNLPDYTQTEADGRPAGYDVDQITVDERQAIEPDTSQPAPQTDTVSKQDDKAPAYSTSANSTIPPGSAENYGQADTLRQDGTYEQNTGQPDYSNQQGYNEPAPTLPQDDARQASPTHPDGPAGPYSQGIKETTEAPQTPDEQYNHELNHPSEPTSSYNREQRGTLKREDI